ncbi:MAG: tetratricopeptide repeat protein [Planctomycetota bacterium]
MRWLVLVLAGLGAVAPAPPSVAETQDPCARALQLLAGGMSEAAIAELTGIDERAAPCTQPLLLMAYLETMRFEQGLALIDRILGAARERDLDPGVVEPMVELLAQAGQIRRGLDLLEKMRQRSEAPKASILVLEARLRFSVGEVEETIACCRTLLEAATSTGPGELPSAVEASVRYLLGASLARAGRADSARAELERALALDPGRGPARLELARWHLRAREYSQAAAAFREHLRRSPRDVGALQGLSQALLRSGEADEGRRALARFVAENEAAETKKDLQRTVESNPGNLVALADLAEFLEQRWGQPRAALPLIDRALGQVHGSTESPALAARLRFARARVLRALGRPTEAFAECMRAVELAPDLDAARVEAAEIAALRGDPRRAHDILARLRVARTDERVLLLQAEIVGRLGLGWEYLEPVVKQAVQAGRSLEALMAWVDAASAFGEQQVARRELDRWVTERPGDPRPLIARAALALAVEAWEPSREDLTQALAHDPFDAAAHALLATWSRRQGLSAEAEAAERRSRDLRYLSP